MSNAILLLGTMFVLLFVGVPICYSVTLSSVIYLLVTNMRPLILLPQRMFVGMDSFILLAIPLFTFSGYLMEKGGLSKRLVDVVEKCVGNVPGGAGTVAILCCTIFAALSGSGPATVTAIGSIMIPAMIRSGYTKGHASAICAAGGALGPIIPPSIQMIIYGSLMSLSIPDMFIGSIVPGLFIAAVLIAINTFRGVKNNLRMPEAKHYTGKEVLKSLINAIPVLILPVIILGGIYGGIFTPTEAAAAAVVYSLILSVVYREMKMADLIDALKRTVTTSAMVLAIISMSNAFGWILTAARIPSVIANSLIPVLNNQYIYMFVLMVILFFVGCVMDASASILILAPILVPIGTALGINPMHLGIVFNINLIVGYVTPPFGVNLFCASAVGGVPFVTLVKEAWPYLIGLILAVMVIAFVPWLTLCLL